LFLKIGLCPEVEWGLVGGGVKQIYVTVFCGLQGGNSANELQIFLVFLELKSG
jgi:hypothetical protein